MAVVMPLALEPTQRLVGIRKEYHARKRKDEHVVYICMDRDREYMLASQRLAKIADYINEHCISDCTKANRVSFAGLIENVDAQGKTNGSWHKGRWKTTAVGLQKAKDFLESSRENYQTTVLIGDPRCYHLRD